MSQFWGSLSEIRSNRALFRLSSPSTKENRILIVSSTLPSPVLSIPASQNSFSLSLSMLHSSRKISPFIHSVHRVRLFAVDDLFPKLRDRGGEGDLTDTG